VPPLQRATGTPCNHLQYPTDSVLLAVLWRLRYTLSLRDLAEMLLFRAAIQGGERASLAE
jgi:transposase-like protein